MRKPILFLLNPDTNPARPEGWWCPDCAMVEGMLTYYPGLAEIVDVRRIDFPRPRRDIVELVGEAFQDSPCLLLDPAAGPPEAPVVNGWRVVTENTKLILDTLSTLPPGFGRVGKGSFF